MNVGGCVARARGLAEADLCWPVPTCPDGWGPKRDGHKRAWLADLFSQRRGKSGPGWLQGFLGITKAARETANVHSRFGRPRLHRKRAQPAPIRRTCCASSQKELGGAAHDPKQRIGT